MYPGAVLFVRQRGKVLFHEGVGRLTYDSHSPSVSTQTLYDLASLTKPLATVSSILLLVQEKTLDLSQSLDEVLEEAKGLPWGTVSIKDLLCHQSGLPAWRPYYQRFSGTQLADSSVRQERIQAYVQFIIQESKEEPSPFGSVYSDLGYILLGVVVERLMKQSLGKFCQQRLFSLLHASPLFFVDPNDTRRSEKAAMAPTQEDSWRGTCLQGEVDDANAWALGGMAGHAGLFGTAKSVGQVTKAWLDGYLGKPGLFDPELVRTFVTPQKGESWALGWDTPSKPSSSGHYFSSESFGHLGFTGTSIWIDPTKELEVIVLSNRVHPDPKNDGIKSFRPRLHDVIVKGL